MAKGESLVSPSAKNVHDVVTAMCAKPGRSFRKQSHAEPLHALLSSSDVTREVADFFVEATTLTAAFTGVRTTESMDALAKLCQIRSPVVDNLLHCIAQMSDTEQTTAVMDATGPRAQEASSSTVAVSFEAQRRMARQELERRGSPAYGIRHYRNISERLIEIEVLGENRDPQAVSRLGLFFESGDAKEKRAVIQALGAIGDPGSAARLMEIFLEAKDEKTRRAAVRGLVDCKTEESQSPLFASTLLGCLTDADSSVREVALQWLKRSKDAYRRLPETRLADSRQLLVAMLQDADLNVRYLAVDSLGEVGAADDIVPLEECAKRLKPAAVPRVKEAIKRIKQRAASS